MRKLHGLDKIYRCIFIVLFSMLAGTGCSGENGSVSDRALGNAETSEETEETEETEENLPEEPSQAGEPSQTGEAAAAGNQGEGPEPVTEEADWSGYFDGINGAAVIYDPTENHYQIYQQELALTRRPPCSTFKIISSLIALEHGIIDPDDSVRVWSGETFWNGDWNRDIDFTDAFHTSCVWYFREVIDEIGKDRMQEELDRLSYGNCNISDWEGHLNTNNSNPALTGFWIESSLLISPKEQAEVMERIFGEHPVVSEETKDQLERVMRLADQEEADLTVYGKTGMGKANGVVADAWFTGFADDANGRIYFCVYMGETDDREVSSARAREAAVEIVSDYLAGDF